MMDAGMFKASRVRLTAWIVVPLVLASVAGLSSHALRLQSQWSLSRTEKLAEALPKLAHTQQQGRELLDRFHESDSSTIQSEDELISFLREAAQRTDFVIDSLKVERRVSAQSKMLVLVASVKGSGSFEAIQKYLGDAAARQPLLFENSLKVSGASRSVGSSVFEADIVFELLMLNGSK